MAEYSEKRSKIYFDPYRRVHAIKITPGEFCVVTDGAVIVTVLGSCVSACVRDRELGIGGMNHFLLANVNESQPLNEPLEKMGGTAMDNFIDHLLRSGAKRENLEAKIFGGGNILNVMSRNNAGVRSAQFVRDYLIDHDIPIVASDTLDIFPRKIYYFPQTGKVFVKKLLRVKNETILVREHEYSTRLYAGRLS